MKSFTESEIAGKLLMMLAKQIGQRVAKGFDTYGQTLDECPPDAYDWQQMQIEELLDGLQYALKENKRLRDLAKQAEVLEKENARMKEQLDGIQALIGRYSG